LKFFRVDRCPPPEGAGGWGLPPSPATYPVAIVRKARDQIRCSAAKNHGPNRIDKSYLSCEICLEGNEEG